MKFYTDKKENLSVTTDVNKKRIRIAMFINGEFETDNPDIIKKLKTKFRCEESPKVRAKILSYRELQKKAKKKHINTFGMKKKDIEKALEKIKE